MYTNLVLDDRIAEEADGAFDCEEHDEPEEDVVESSHQNPIL